jgi:hypothetical protein
MSFFYIFLLPPGRRLPLPGRPCPSDFSPNSSQQHVKLAPSARQSYLSALCAYRDRDSRPGQFFYDNHLQLHQLYSRTTRVELALVRSAHGRSRLLGLVVP